MVNVYAKLYGASHVSVFYRDYLAIVAHIRHFRDSLRSRGWAVPESEQERLIGVLVTRCQKYLVTQGNDRAFIPAYFGQSLKRYVGELADQLNHKFKMMPQPGQLSPEARAKFQEAIMASVLPGLREKWRAE